MLQNREVKQRDIQLYLSAVLLITAAVALMGWYHKSEAIQALGYGHITMKPTTAVCFIIVGLINLLDDWINKVLVFILNGLLTLIVVVYLYDPIESFATMPSIPTIICFYICANASLQPNTYNSMNKIIKAVSIIALIGHMIYIPQLYYHIPPYSNGMSLHTAVLFLHIGLFFRKKN